MKMKALIIRLYGRGNPMEASDRSYSYDRDRQSYVSRSGREWELYVHDYLNRYFTEHKSNLFIVDGKSIDRRSELWHKLAIPVGLEDTVEGDTDLVIVNKKDPDAPLGVISCKTSLHGRFSETLFYAVVWKQQIPGILVYFATPDKGRQAKKGIWESEWGTPSKPTKDRRLAERFLDGVYIYNKHTVLGGKIKALKDLPQDLQQLLGH